MSIKLWTINELPKDDLIEDLRLYDAYTIKYPKLFREMYYAFVFKNEVENSHDYTDLLKRLLATNTFNYRALDSCDFVEYLYQNICFLEKGDSYIEIVLELAIFFLNNFPSLSVLRVLNKQLSRTLNHQNQVLDETTLGFDLSTPFVLKWEKTILQELYNNLHAGESRSTRGVSLSTQDSNLHWKCLWIPSISFQPAIKAESPGAGTSTINDSLTILAHISIQDIDLLKNKGHYTLFLLADTTGSLIFRVYVKQGALIIKSDRQEIVASSSFLQNITKTSPTATKEFTLALTFTTLKDTTAFQTFQRSSVTTYINGTEISKSNLEILAWRANNMSEKQCQLIVGPCEDTNSIVTTDIKNFVMLRRALNRHEVQDLHIITVGSVTPLNFTSRSIELNLQKLDKESLERLPLELNLGKSIAFYSEASFNEKTVIETLCSNILKDLIVHYSPGLGVKRLRNCARVQDELIAELQTCSYIPQEDVQHVLSKEFLAFIPNLASSNTICSNALLIGCRSEKRFVAFRPEVWDEPRKQAIDVLEESSIVDTLIAKLLKARETKHSDSLQNVLKILVCLFRKSNKARKHLIEANVINFICGVLEFAQSLEEEEDLFEICQDLFVEVFDGSAVGKAQKNEKESGERINSFKMREE